MSAAHRTHAPLTVLGGRDILFVMAAEAEYGPLLIHAAPVFEAFLGPSINDSTLCRSVW